MSANMDLDDLQMMNSTELYQFVSKDFDALTGTVDSVFNSIPIQPVEESSHSSVNFSGIASTSAAPSRILQQEVSQPYVEILEQPKSRGLRFRYKCEGRSAGSIPGETSTPEHKRFPSIKLHNFQGNYFIVVVSCVSKDDPHKPHPHNLVGRDCKRGVCTIKVRDTHVVSFPHLGIQCAKKNDVEHSLTQRKEINVDPYQTGFDFPFKNIDLNSVRLCFQVFLPDKNMKPTRIVPPVSSQIIYDKKSLNELVICRVDRASGKARGGEEVFLLCEKINRDDIKVRFYREVDGNLYWEEFGDFGQNDVHRQFAIVFKTPAYQDIFITSPVEVKLQLYRPSDGEISDSITFTYRPEDPDPDRIQDKRKRKSDVLRDFFDTSDSSAPTVSPEEIKARLKLKAKHSQLKQEIKEEAVTPAVPSYSFENIGSGRNTGIGLQNMGKMSVITSDNTTMGNVIFNPAVSSQVQGSAYNPMFLQQGNISGQSLISQTTSGEQFVNNFYMGAAGNRSNAPATITSQSISSGSDVVLADVNMSAARTQDNLTSVDLNMFQAYLGDQGGTTVSFESIDGLSGNLANIDYDPNIGAMESVGDSGHLGAVSSSQIEETEQAIKALSQSN